MRTLKGEQNTLRALNNVETGLKGAHAGLDALQEIVDKARALMADGDHDGVQACVRHINNALYGVVPLSLARESDLRAWEV